MLASLYADIKRHDLPDFWLKRGAAHLSAASLPHGVPRDDRARRYAGGARPRAALHRRAFPRRGVAAARAARHLWLERSNLVDLGRDVLLPLPFRCSSRWPPGRPGAWLVPLAAAALLADIGLVVAIRWIADESRLAEIAGWSALARGGLGFFVGCALSRFVPLGTMVSRPGGGRARLASRLLSRRDLLLAVPDPPADPAGAAEARSVARPRSRLAAGACHRALHGGCRLPRHLRLRGSARPPAVQARARPARREAELSDAAIEPPSR